MNPWLPLGLVLATSVSTLQASPEATPSPAPSLEVIARDGADKEKHLFSHGGFVGQLVVRQNQTVPVTLQFPSDKAGMPVALVTLDGGRIGGGDLVVSPKGRVVFTFGSGVATGRYRVEVRTVGEQYHLEFYVVDPNRPPRQQRPGSGH